MSDIVAVWRAVAEDYAPFDVDVTTIQPASLSNTAMQYISHVCIGGDGTGPGFSSSGGVAYVGVFGLSNNYYYQPAFVFPKNLGPGEQQLLAAVAITTADRKCIAAAVRGVHVLLHKQPPCSCAKSIMTH
jgi:hypothetical protein